MSHELWLAGADPDDRPTLAGQGAVTRHDRFARCPGCGRATVGLDVPYAINHAPGCSLPDPVYLFEEARVAAAPDYREENERLREALVAINEASSEVLLADTAYEERRSKDDLVRLSMALNALEMAQNAAAAALHAGEV